MNYDNFYKKISLIISSILSVLLLSFPTTQIVDNIEDNTIIDDVATQEKVITENEISKTDQKELQEESSEKEKVENKKETITSTNSNQSITTDSNKETTTNIEQNNNSTSSSNNDVEEKEDVLSNNNKNQYVGIPNPNDFYYSFHHGKIEYSSMEACLKNEPRVSLKDTVDILNTNCMDVVDGQGTILGQYLYINCLSGNCDKYK